MSRQHADDCRGSSGDHRQIVDEASDEVHQAVVDEPTGGSSGGGEDTGDSMNASMKGAARLDHMLRGCRRVCIEMMIGADDTLGQVSEDRARKVFHHVFQRSTVEQ